MCSTKFLIARNSGKSSLACEGSVKSDTGRRPGREGIIHMGTILNLTKRQMYLLKVMNLNKNFKSESSKVKVNYLVIKVIW